MNDKEEIIISSSIKEIGIKFIFIFLVLFILGYFIKSLELNVIKSLVMSLGMALVDFIAYIIKKHKSQHSK